MKEKKQFIDFRNWKNKKKQKEIKRISVSAYWNYTDEFVVLFIVEGNGTSDPSSNQEEAVSISHKANTLGKSVHPAIPPLVIGK